MFNYFLHHIPFSPPLSGVLGMQLNSIERVPIHPIEPKNEGLDTNNDRFRCCMGPVSTQHREELEYNIFFCIFFFESLIWCNLFLRLYLIPPLLDSSTVFDGYFLLN